MIKIQIGEAVRDYEDVTESWIIQQINDRRRDGLPVCVKVTIKEGPLNMILSTPGCSVAPGGSRQAKPSEQEVFDLWEHFGLNDSSFAPGKVVAFMKQLHRWIG